MLSKVALILAFAAAAATFAVLAAKTQSESNVKAGILTLREVVSAEDFLRARNIAQDLEDTARSLSIDASALAPSLIDNAKSTVSAVLTAAPGVASRIESAAVALATPSVEGLEQRIPNNCTVGTRLVCVGYAHNTSCSEPPLNLSSLVSEVTSSLPSTLARSIEGGLRDKVDQLQPMADQLSAVSAYFRRLLALGGASMVLLLVLFVYLTLVSLSRVVSVASGFGVRCPMVAWLGVGLVCCIPCILLSALFVVVQAKTKALPPWIEARSGEVSRLCFGALGCAVTMAMLTVVAATMMPHAYISERDATDVKTQHGRSDAVGNS